LTGVNQHLKSLVEPSPKLWPTAGVLLVLHYVMIPPISAAQLSSGCLQQGCSTATVVASVPAAPASCHPMHDALCCCAQVPFSPSAVLACI